MKTEAKPKKPERNIGVLLIEDNPGDATLFRQMLKVSRFPTQLNVVPDGEQALNYLRRQKVPADAPQPDLILLDLNLPKMPGYELLREIKRSRRLSSIPILILTGSNEDADRWKACELRVDAYLLKPKELSHFDALRKYLEENWFEDLLSKAQAAP